MRVVKRSGEVEEFDPGKARNAIVRAGASPDEADRVLEKVEPHLYDGITTEELYRRIRAQLPSPKAQRYSLKKAIMLLGPDGHAFESLMGRLFERMGYEVRVRQIMKGRCVEHEVDLIILKDGIRSVVECKFHNSLGTKSTIQEALYTWGRFLDLKDGNGLDMPWLVTNTRFSSDVVRYGKCMGMHLIGWKYPEDGGLEQLIDRVKLYPVTLLDLRRSEQRTLIGHDFVVCQDILLRKGELLSMLPRDAGERILRKAEDLLRDVKA